MPKFLSQDEVYRIIQRELPEDVYPDTLTPSGYFSTTDTYSAAKVISTAEGNLSRIYENFFPQTADEKIGDHEVMVFGQAGDSSVPLQTRRDRVVTKIRSRIDMSAWSLMTNALLYLPAGTVVQLYENGRFTGGWKLGISKLGFDTRLGDVERLIFSDPAEYKDPVYPGWTLGYSKLGLNTKLGAPAGSLTATKYHLARHWAYSYEFRVFAHTLTTDERAAIEGLLTSYEPARSKHVLLDALNLEDYFLGGTVTPVGKLSNVDCIYVDTNSETGYSGRVVNVS